MSTNRKSDPSCPRCRGTGTRDTGGFQPWGDLIFEDCDCHVEYARSRIIDHNKNQFAIEIAAAATDRCLEYVKVMGKPYAEHHLEAGLRLLILDAVEFGIQLGGMGLENNHE